jgi:serine/threonine protein kinase
MSHVQGASAGAEAGPLIAGRYRLEASLGSGAMGEVFRAVDMSPQANGREVALKLLNPIGGARGDESRARFLREARAGANIQSPHVVPVSDYGFDPETDKPFLVMGLLKGLDLAALIEREGALKPTVAVRIACQAAWGVSAAHRMGIIHRDLKPANIFLHHDEQQNVTVKVCDFGIAKLEEEGAGLTQTGHVLGTPLFMSPEQLLHAKRVTEAADVWGLASTLYAALAGRAPLEHLISGGLTELLIALNEDGRIPHIQELAPWVQGPIAVAVHGGLIRDPALRCPTAKAWLDVLEPRAGGTLALRAQMLTGVNDRQRSQHAAKAAQLPRAWDEVSRLLANTSTSDAEQERDPLLGTKVGGRYELTRVLGRGGMGAVYEAWSGSNRYAVKLILDEAQRSPHVAQRFVREARASMSIKSPNVVQVVEADADPAHGGRPYMVMEMMKGGDLERAIRTYGALDPQAAVRVFMQVCRGLEVAHAQGVVHRDIKPANIFLHEASGAELVAKVCDFGIAKSLLDDEDAASLTRTGGLLGSPMYMSPEQARSAKRVDHRTDIWSLGAALYEALSGRKLWGDSLSVGELILSICTKEPPSLREAAPWLDPGLAEVVHRALKRAVEERFATVAQLLEALRPFAGGRDALAPSDIRSVASDFSGVAVNTLRASAGSATADAPTEAGDVLITADSADIPPKAAPASAKAAAAVATALDPSPAHLRTIGAEAPSSNNTLMIIGIILGGVLILGAGLWMILG